MGALLKVLIPYVDPVPHRVGCRYRSLVQFSEGVATGTETSRLSKQLLDTDRLTFATEAGYDTGAGKMWPPYCSVKNDMLVGAPQHFGLGAWLSS